MRSDESESWGTQTESVGDAWIAHPLAVGGTGGGVPSQAQNVNQLQQRQQQIQHQIQSTQRRLGELRQAEEEARRRMGSLQQNIRQTESSLRDNQYRLEQAQKALEQAQKELQELEDRLRRQQQGTAARLRYMQRQGAEHWWALLLTSRDLNEFFDRRHQLQLLIEADRQLIQELQAMAKEVDQQRIALEMQRNEISLILQELAAQKNQLQQQAVAQEQLLSRLANERAAYEAAQRRLEADSQQLTLLIQQLIAQQAQQQGAGIPFKGRADSSLRCAGRSPVALAGGFTPSTAVAAFMRGSILVCPPALR